MRRSMRSFNDMSDVSSKKIGKRAVDYLRRIISQHNTMDHSFNEDDTH